MKQVFITGASGFIGRSIGDRLRADGVTVVGVDLRTDPDRGVVAGDINVDQAQTYLFASSSALDVLAAHPQLARACDEVKPGYRRPTSGSHIVFYLDAADGIDVIRILTSASTQAATCRSLRREGHRTQTLKRNVAIA